MIQGFRAEEILGRHFSRFFLPEDVRRGWPRFLLRSAARQGSVEDHGWRIRRNGILFWADVVITALRDEEGHLLGFAKILRDLTEKRRAEEERERLLAERDAERTWLQAVIERCPSGMIVVRSDGAVQILANQRAEQILGHPVTADRGLSQR